MQIEPPLKRQSRKDKNRINATIQALTGKAKTVPNGYLPVNQFFLEHRIPAEKKACPSFKAQCILFGHKYYAKREILIKLRDNNDFYNSKIGFN